LLQVAYRRAVELLGEAVGLVHGHGGGRAGGAAADRKAEEWLLDREREAVARLGRGYLCI
jgi:hypothetical protein